MQGVWKVKIMQITGKKEERLGFFFAQAPPCSSFLAALLLTPHALSHFTMMQKKNKNLLAYMHLIN